MKRMPRDARQRRERHFPGYQAGASLKRQRLHDVVSPAVDFPGYQAGASLKRAPHARPGRRTQSLPRLPSRGLIEACEAARALAP